MRLKYMAEVLYKTSAIENWIGLEIAVVLDYVLLREGGLAIIYNCLQIKTYSDNILGNMIRARRKVSSRNTWRAKIQIILRICWSNYDV